MVNYETRRSALTWLKDVPYNGLDNKKADSLVRDIILVFCKYEGHYDTRARREAVIGTFSKYMNPGDWVMPKWDEAMKASSWFEKRWKW